MVAILVVATLGNLVVGQMVPRSIRPVNARDGGSLIELVNTSQRAVAIRYGFYFAMGEQEGSRLIVFPGAEVNPVLLGAFGGKELEVAQYEPTGHELGDLGEPHGEVRTDDLRIVDFWVIDGEPGDTFWLAEQEDGYVAVPESVLPFPGGRG